MTTWFEKKKKAHKYGAIKTFAHGRHWPSKLELAVYELLLLMERGGAYRDIKCQVHVKFHTHDHGNVHYIPDFSAHEVKSGETIFIEAKGVFTREFLRKKKAWAVGGPGRLIIYGGNWRRPTVMEIIYPKKPEAA